MPMTEAQQTERIAGDPTYVRQLWAGEVALPVLNTARARWEWQQADRVKTCRTRARMTTSILDQLIEDIGPDMADCPVNVLRDAFKRLANEEPLK
jgi:hypothetical protein